MLEAPALRAPEENDILKMCRSSIHLAGLSEVAQLSSQVQ